MLNRFQKQNDDATFQENARQGWINSSNFQMILDDLMCTDMNGNEFLQLVITNLFPLVI